MVLPSDYYRRKGISVHLEDFTRYSGITSLTMRQFSSLLSFGYQISKLERVPSDNGKQFRVDG